MQNFFSASEKGSLRYEYFHALSGDLCSALVLSFPTNPALAQDSGQKLCLSQERGATR